MDFTITNEVTRDFLLRFLNEETIFCYYLHLNTIPKKLICSPLRDDKRPTVGFYRNSSGSLIFHDFATGEFLTCWSLVARLKGITYHQALKLIASDFNIQGSSITTNSIHIIPKCDIEQKETIIRVELDDFSSTELKWWQSFGVTKPTLDYYRVYSIKTVFLNGNVLCRKAQHNPIYGYYFGKKGDVEQWKIYMPQSKTRFIGNISKKTIQGYKQLPKNGELLIITKSMKDVCSLHSYGVAAIAPQSETSFVSDKMLAELQSRFKRIVVWFDTDLAGIHSMRILKKQYPQLEYFFIPRKYHAKDFSDYIRDTSVAEGQSFLEKYIL